MYDFCCSAIYTRICRGMSTLWKMAYTQSLLLKTIFMWTIKQFIEMIFQLLSMHETIKRWAFNVYRCTYTHPGIDGTWFPIGFFGYNFPHPVMPTKKTGQAFCFLKRRGFREVTYNRNWKMEINLEIHATIPQDWHNWSSFERDIIRKISYYRSISCDKTTI